MRIGIDARESRKGRFTGLRTIMETFLHNLSREQGVEIILFCNQHTDLEALPGWMEKKIIKEDLVLLWDQIRLPIAIKKANIDVFFSPYIKTPLYRVCPYVNSISDIIPLKISKYRGIMSVLEKAHFVLYALVCGTRAARVVTLSRDAREKVSKTFDIDPKRIEVVYPAISPLKGGHGEFKRLKDEHGLDRDYILYVGNFKTHKNVDRLIEAYRILSDNVREGHDLVLLGGTAEEAGRIMDKIDASGLKGKVKVLLNIEHEAVGSFMERSSLFVFPSLAEGFGMPPVEAMSMGIPVASSGIPPMTEVLGDAAVYFDPTDPRDISDKMESILNDDALKDSLASRGRERAAGYTAQAMTDGLMRTISSAARVRTLCVSSEFPPVLGGISTHIYNLWKRLPRHKIAILTSDTGQINDPLEKDIIRAKYPTGFDPVSRMVRTLAVICLVWRENCRLKIKKNHAAQVISSGLAALIVKFIKGTPYVPYVYSADILEFSKNPVTSFILRAVLSESEKIVANSNFTMGLLVDRGLASKDKVLISTPAVDMEKFLPAAGGDGLRRKYNIGEHEKLLLTVSRLAERKGQEQVIKALKSIRAEYPDTKYLLVGDGERRSYLEEVSRREGLADRVIFAGSLPGEDLAACYRACDIFVMTPRMLKDKGDVEGFGIVFLEANACGKPVIAGLTGGVAEAVSHGETGILVDPENVDEIANAIKRLLGDPGLCRKMGDNGITRMREQFNWETRAKELEGLI